MLNAEKCTLTVPRKSLADATVAHDYSLQKQKHLAEGKEFIAKLSEQDKVQMERDIASLSTIKVEENKPVVLDFESIQMVKPGQYEIDLIHLMKRDPLVFKLGEGKYMIDIPKLFKN